MLRDESGRTFSYLRLSITDQCNFRCFYCLPHGYQKTPGQLPFLSLDEIRRLATAFAQFGFCKIRLTGGEPTLRKDFLAIASCITAVPNIRKLMLSTNGYRLFQDAELYRSVGIHGINVSVDSLDEAKFHKLTGHNKLRSILKGIDRSIALGLSPVKVNAVLMKGINDDEIPQFVAWAKERPVSVRFIELMPTGMNQATFREYHTTAEGLKTYLKETGWTPKLRAYDAGPAQEYTHSDFIGTVGVIAPYAKHFCETCNRLRITSLGELKLCLFGTHRYSLRHLLQADDQTSELKKTLERLLLHKGATHQLHDGQFGQVMHFAGIGG